MATRVHPGCTQGASSYAKMCLQIEEPLLVAVLPLLNLVGHGDGDGNMEAGVCPGVVLCAESSVGTACVLKY